MMFLAGTKHDVHKQTVAADKRTAEMTIKSTKTYQKLKFVNKFE